MKKSIISNSECCYFCKTTQGLHTHHCLFGSNRKMADKYGLTVRLCYKCHNDVHMHHDKALILMQLAQKVFEEHYGHEEYMRVFGRNYLTDIEYEEEDEMNQVALIGRLTRDPDIRYTAGENPTAVARFTIAINKGKDKNGKDKGADYPGCVAFGKTAEIVEKYLVKGSLISVSGRIATSFYEKDGTKHYQTEVAVEKLGFLEPKKKEDAGSGDVPAGFTELTDDDIPF